jgi:hypothetical protein
MDKGPWKVIPATGMRGGVCVASDDFTHDVLLRINGDFESDTQRLAYADWLAAKLNSTADQPDPAPDSEAYQFREMMALMHGDGGHYLAAHGPKKSADDAIAKYYRLMLQAESADQPSLRRCPDCDTPMWPAEFNVPCGRCATMKADQQKADQPAVVRCGGCKQEIDPDCCCCGSPPKDHTWGDGHAFVPMGCVCGYVTADQQSAKDQD